MPIKFNHNSPLNKIPPDFEPDDPINQARKKIEEAKKNITILSRGQPYYKEEYARAAEQILRKVITTKRAMRIQVQGQSILSLRTQYYQGLQYFIDNLDSTGEIAKFKAMTRCCTNFDDYYIEIRMKRSLINATPEDPEENPADWRVEFFDFLENSTRGQKYQRFLPLTDADVQWMSAQLDPLGDKFLSKITREEQLIIKDSD